MGDRELRDEIEVLYGELKRERAKADAPLADELAKARTRLQEEIVELTARRQALRGRLQELEQLKAQRKNELATARRELSKARATIAERQPLGDPLAPSLSNWENQEQTGCASVCLVACVALSALGWWLS